MINALHLAKVCINSAISSGGDIKAIKHGILTHYRRDLGMSKRDFATTSFYPELENVIEVFVNEVIADSEIIQALLEKSRLFIDININSGKDLVVGPTGHSFLLKKEQNEDKFYENFDYYLQTYEFALLGNSVIEVIKEYSEVELIGHFDDSVVLLVPIIKSEEVLKYYKDKAVDLSKNLGVSIQEFETRVL